MALHSRAPSRRRLLRAIWSGRPGSRAQAVSAAEDVEFDDDGAASDEQPLFYPPPTRVSAPGRVVAIGDLHGDLAQVRARQAARSVTALFLNAQHSLASTCPATCRPPALCTSLVL
jgi:hypothetical protein